MQSTKAIGACALFGLVLGLAGCAPKPDEAPAPATPPAFSAGAVRALCATEAGGPVFLFIGDAPTDGEAGGNAQRVLPTRGASADEAVTLLTLQPEGALTRSDFVLGPEASVAGGAIEQVLRSNDALAGALTRASRGGPASGLTLGTIAHRCRNVPDLRLAAVSASEVILVRRTGPMSAEVRRMPRAGGPEAACAQAALEEGRSSMTVTESCGDDRRILYAPVTAPASEATWRDSVKTTEETLIAAFIAWAPPTDP